MPRDFSWKTIPTQEYELLVRGLEALEPMTAAIAQTLTLLSQPTITLADLAQARSHLRDGLMQMEAQLPEPPAPEDHKRLRIVH